MQNESGRSLTEMIGMLAIMGILAIAGIWMYNSAMNKLKANTIINEAQKRAVVVAGQIGFQGRTDPSLGEFSDNTFAGGTFSTDVVTDGLYQQFGIQVSNVSKNVCQNILNSIGNGSSIRRLSISGNPTTAMTTCADNNTFLMVYNNDMSSGNNETKYATADCSCQTVCGVCVVQGGETKCANECPTSPTQCTQNSDCSGGCVGCVIPSGQTKGTCQSCTRVAYLQASGTQYIDTGFKPTGATKILFKYQTPTQGNSGVGGSSGQQGLFGARDDNINRFTLFTGQVRNSFQADYNTQSSLAAVSTTINGVDDRAVNTIEMSNSFVVNGNTIKTTTALTFQNSRTMYLFANNNYGSVQVPMTGKMWYFKIWDSEMLVHDFIPVYAPFQPADKQNCMYDKVTKALFCNQGTGGDFVAGN